MGLKEGVEEIASQMEHEAELAMKGILDPTERTSLRGWARQLRTLCKAAAIEGTPIPPAQYTEHLQMPPMAFHAQQIDAARQEFRKANAQEQSEPTMTPVVGGPSDGVYAPVDAKMDLGAKSLIAGAVYLLTDLGDGKRRLVYNEEETSKMAAQVRV